MSSADTSTFPTSEYLGACRVLSPRGTLAQPAKRLDRDMPMRDSEIAIDVDVLYLDSTSFRQLTNEADADIDRIAARIREIVGDAGKMHNPVTGSGGVLVGRVASVGAQYPSPPAVGLRIVSLCSLTQIPLSLESVGPVSLNSPQIPVRGKAYLPAAAPWSSVPADIPEEMAVAALDVCGAASHTRDLSQAGSTVLVLGAGHAGLLAAAAAREAVGPSGRVVMADIDGRACERAAMLCDVVVMADLCDTLSSLRALDEAGIPPADLTVAVVNTSNFEMTAILGTRVGGTVLFFSMATSFTAAALGAEGVAHDVRMLIGSGYASDHGAYAFDLIRRHKELKKAFSTE